MTAPTTSAPPLGGGGGAGSGGGSSSNSPLLAVLLVTSSSRGSHLVFRWPRKPRLQKRHSRVRYYAAEADGPDRSLAARLQGRGRLPDRNGRGTAFSTVQDRAAAVRGVDTPEHYGRRAVMDSFGIENVDIAAELGDEHHHGVWSDDQGSITSPSESSLTSSSKTSWTTRRRMQMTRTQSRGTTEGARLPISRSRQLADGIHARLLRGHARLRGYDAPSTPRPEARLATKSTRGARKQALRTSAPTRTRMLKMAMPAQPLAIATFERIAHTSATTATFSRRC